jgi:hypothetical protein
MPKTLIATNPYLRDPKARRAALLISAATSSAVEGIRKPFAAAESTATTESRTAHRKAAKSVE